jgi:hypothetical protein
MAICRMLQNAAETLNCTKGSSKAAGIIAKLELMRFARAAMPEAPPALAGRMRYDRVRTCVGSRVATERPRINARQTRVASTIFDAHASIRTSASGITWAHPSD